MLARNSCGCGRGRMHVERIRGRTRTRGRRRRNVCGAGCGNVISRYVAVGRPSSSWHRHLPTYDLSFVSRREEPGSSSLSPTRRAKTSGEANRRNFPFLTKFSFVSLTFLSLSLSSRAALATSRSHVPARVARTRKWIASRISVPEVYTDIPPQPIGRDWDMDFRELIQNV